MRQFKYWKEGYKAYIEGKQLVFGNPYWQLGMTDCDRRKTEDKRLEWSYGWFAAERDGESAGESGDAGGTAVCIEATTFCNSARNSGVRLRHIPQRPPGGDTGW